MLLTEFIKVKWHPQTRLHYEKMGHVFTNYKDQIIIRVTDLLPTSGEFVDVLCDYCEVEVMHIRFREYTRGRKIIKKDSCKKCSGKKLRDSNIKIFGVPSTSLLPEVRQKQINTMIKKYGTDIIAHIPEVQEKKKETCLERYGHESPLQSEEIKQKIKNSVQEKYGVEHYSQTQEYHDKIRVAHRRKYGVDHYFQTDEFKEVAKITNIEKYGAEVPSTTEKIKNKIIETSMEKYGSNHFVSSIYYTETMQDKYGVDNASQNPDIKNKIAEKRYENGTAPSSIQQKYIHSLLGGELNYPVGGYSLDITFPQEKIYIEYNGGGHRLNVLMGNITDEEFDEKEKRRYYKLKNIGWKVIYIESKNDKLPDDNCLLEMVSFAKSHFINGRSWIRYDIDISRVISHVLNEFFDFKKLRKIKEGDYKKNECV